MRLFASGLIFASGTSLALTSLFSVNLPAQADQQTCVVTNDGATVCGRLTKQQPKKSNSTSQQRKEVGQFTYLLKGCKRSDTTIKCSYSVTNKKQQENMGFDTRYSSIIDSQGKSYLASNIEVGGKNFSSLGGYVMISPGIDYNVEITFENIPEQITQVPIFQPASKVQFRNVTFSN